MTDNEAARQARRTPHAYEPTGQRRHHRAPLCGVCGLPEGNKVHPGETAADEAMSGSGEWTPTGWGAQHRIRSTDGDRVTLVCHSADQSVHTSRVDTTANETARCSRCTAIPGVGPMPAPTLGEVRRSPQGIVVACLRTWDGRVPTSPVDLCWRVLDAAGTSAHGSLDSYAVAGWGVTGSIEALLAVTQ